MEKEFTRNEFIRFLTAGTAVLIGGPVLAACGKQNTQTASNTAPAKEVCADIETVHAENGTGLNNLGKRAIAEQIISTFENSTTEIQYGFAKKEDDTRGITAGRSGFTSETGDLLLVMLAYQDLSQCGDSPDKRLVAYIPTLQAINNGVRARSDELDGFVEAWQATSASDPRLAKAQDKIYEELYLNPAIASAESANINSPLGQVIILDTSVQHGPTGLAAIIKMTENFKSSNQTERLGKAHHNEQHWLTVFLDIRNKVLSDRTLKEKAVGGYTGKSAAQAVQEVTTRVRTLRKILATNNLNLDLPLSWEVYGDNFKAHL